MDIRPKSTSPRSKSAALSTSPGHPSKSPRHAQAPFHETRMKKPTPISKERSPVRQRHFSFDSVPRTPHNTREEEPKKHEKQRRCSSFAASDSPWARRKSFLSTSMISSEKHLVYELSGYRYGGMGGHMENVPKFSISLRESQGFSWNQDLFASQYQQQSGVIYDDGGDSNDEAIVDEDEEEEGSEDGYSQERYMGRRFSQRAYSYTMSSTEGTVERVKVIDVKVDEE